MNKQIIAIDIDDVLGSQNEAVMRFANRQYGLQLTIEDYSVEGQYWGYWERVWGVDEVEGEKRLRAFLNSGGLHDVRLLPGVIEAISKLEEDYELVVITARHGEYAEDTHKWLSKHFPKVFKDIRFLSIWGDGPKETKAEVAKQIGAGYLIDDNVEHCTLAAEAGVKALLFGWYGWNKAVRELPNGVQRVADWAAVLEYFDGNK